ncbi:MAG: hypothetical protein MJ149_02630, partial [Clostridia bacterium]|nr:hypothetical protein [Clostridia bacterium]
MIELITGLLGQILYPLFSIIFVIIDLLQYIFQGFAGTGTIYYSTGNLGFAPQTITADNTGKETETGIVYYLLNSALVRNMLISIAILALFLLVIFTAMAFIKNVYSSKPKKWQDIVANAFKGLINFIFVPVCCLLGVWAGNILLNAIAGATSASGATDMSRQLFTVSAYNANEYRCKGISGPDEARKIYAHILGTGTDDAYVIKLVPGDKTNEEYALLVDQAYGQGVKDENGKTHTISIYEYIGVEYGYVLFKINYLMLVAGGVFMMYILVNLAYAMVQRMFILLMLFIISPAMAAMYPIDEGNAMNSWKKSFVQYT